MRTLLVLQSLIIIAGAYYVYTLAHTEDERPSTISEPVVSIESVAAPDTDRGSQVETQPIDDLPRDNQPPENMPLGNDIGMEFPIPDNEADLQVR